MSLKTIASFSFPYEAQIAWAKLDSQGIPAFIVDEHTINAQWLYSNALGGVRLRVPDEFAEEAYSILTEDNASDVENEQGYDSVQCTQCGSFNTEFTKARKRGAYLVFLLLDFPLYPVEHEHKCRDCGHVDIT
jgi:DNA-directed RNA polymerase subunit RPC12/RpoP